MTYEYTPSPELAAMAKQVMEREKAVLVKAGLSPDIAELMLNAWVKCAAEAFERAIMTEGSSSYHGGLASLLTEAP